MVWEVSLLAPANETAPGAPSVQPLAIKDQLMIAQKGSRGWMGAYAQEDGAFRWRFYTIPGPGEVGHETWAGDWGAWKTGGAVLWMQGTYDAATNLYYFGTGEAKPWADPEFRPGDNLFSSSLVALDVDSGKLKWFFQVVPNDTHDRDNVNPAMIYDITVNGQPRKVVGQFTRTGFFYTWDRVNGEFVQAEPFTYVNWTQGIDPKTGRPLEYNPNVLVQNYGPNKSVMALKPHTGMNVCPNWIGSPTLMPPTFDAKRQMAFIANADGCYDTVQNAQAPKTDIELGKTRQFPGQITTSLGRQQGRIVSVDVRTGKQVNASLHPWPFYSGTLGTAGDLIFTAQADGKVMAVDKDTLAELWSFHVGTVAHAPPITFAVEGKQYVAIAVGAALRGDLNMEELRILQRNSQIVVFGL
jgi:alcohol dehydrogenase (cytochrome c)